MKGGNSMDQKKIGSFLKGVGQGSGTCPSLLGHVPDPLSQQRRFNIWLFCA